MIYTTHGEPVEIVGTKTNPHALIVRSTEDPTWERERHMAELKADGGVEEIRAAIRAVEAGVAS